MANGFALRGFTQGFTQGLQNVNELYNSYVDRDLKRAESERLRGKQDLANRRAEQQLEAGSLELAKSRRDEELAKKQADYPRIYGILNKEGDFSEEDLKALHDYGLGSMLSGEDEADTLTRLAGEVRSGRRPIDDPEVTKSLLPALQPMMNRDIGGVGRDPRTGQSVRIAAKVPTGFRNISGKVVPMLSVRGAGQDGQYVEYEAPATQFGSSLPDDPLLALTNERAAQKLEGAAKLNRQIAKNPELKSRLQEYAGVLANGVPKPTSERDRAYSRNQEDQIRSRQLQDQIKRLEYISSESQGKAKEQAEMALTELRKEKINTERSVQGKNYSTAAFSEARRSRQENASKSEKFTPKLASEWANMRIKPDMTDIAGKPIYSEKAQVKRTNYVNALQGLMGVGGAKSFDEADRIASDPNSQFVSNYQTSRGLANGYVTVIEGKKRFVPTEWVK